MTSRDFCYWLQGYFELTNPTELNFNQIETIRKHLDMVFIHEIDPTFGGQKEQDKLNNIHNGNTLRPPLARC
jgi:pentose-5-phosphate-3-epimerase